MGADDWSICPRCLAKANKKRDAAMAKADAAYGQIPANEWQAMKQKAEDMTADIDKSVAQYYEFNLDDAGFFSASFSASCRNNGCGFEFVFEYEEAGGVKGRPAPKQTNP